jgi:hypothetical protein
MESPESSLAHIWSLGWKTQNLEDERAGTPQASLFPYWLMGSNQYEGFKVEFLVWCLGALQQMSQERNAKEIVSPSMS